MHVVIANYIAKSTQFCPVPGHRAFQNESLPVFENLKEKNWLNVADRTGRQHAELADTCIQAMTLSDHHEWIQTAASKLLLAGDILWQVLCAEWVKNCLSDEEAKRVVQPIEDTLIGLPITPSILTSLPSELELPF